jgi:hypothetical protein
LRKTPPASSPKCEEVEGSSTREAAKLGAQYELAVCTDLLRQGFDVFRNLAPVGITEVVAIKNGCVLRVQLKPSGGFAAAVGNDVLAVYNNGRILIESLIVNYCRYSIRLMCLQDDRRKDVTGIPRDVGIWPRIHRDFATSA